MMLDTLPLLLIAVIAVVDAANHPVKQKPKPGFQEKRIMATCNQNGIVLLDQFLGNDADAACLFFSLRPYTATAPMDTVLASAMDNCFGGATQSAWVAGQCTAFGQVNPTFGTTQLRACTNLFRVACTSTAPPPVITQVTLTSQITRSVTTTEFDFSTSTIVQSVISSTTTTSPLVLTITFTSLTFTVTTVYSTRTTTGTSTAIKTITTTTITGTTDSLITTTILVPSTRTFTTVSTIPISITITTTSTRAVPLLTTIYSCPITTAPPLTTTTTINIITTTTSLVECPSTLTRTVPSTQSRLAIITITDTISMSTTSAVTVKRSTLLTCPLVLRDMLLVLTPADWSSKRSVCAQFGLAPISLTDDNFNDASVLVGRCLGARGAAWLGSWSGDDKSCAALEASGVLGQGSRVREAPCEAALPVLCQK